MRYSIEPRDTVYVKGYGFLSLAKNLSNKYSQKLIDAAEKSTADALKTASKKAVQKAAEKTSDSFGNKIADKITSVSKKLVKELHNNDQIEDVELTINKKDTYHEKKENKVLMN